MNTAGVQLFKKDDMCAFIRLEICIGVWDRLA